MMFDGGEATLRHAEHGIGNADRALVVGLGMTGLSVARWLASRGIAVAVTDSRQRPPQLEALLEALPDVALFLGGFSQDALRRASVVVLSPGVAREEPFVQEALDRGIPVIGDIELFSREVRAPVVAVTGSNGKSTVATLVGLMGEHAGIRTALGGNLGTPALELLQDDVALYVLELSSFQLESTSSLDAAAAAVLNISADHMDRYPDLAGYAAAKSRIWSGNGIVVANREDGVVAGMVPHTRRIVWFGMDEPARRQDYGTRDMDGRRWLVRGSDPLMPVSELRMAGRHNAANALAAWALAAAAGIHDEDIAGVLRTFSGLPHRMETVRNHHGVIWIDDSKATNTGATLAAVSGSDGPLVMILGGDGKGQSFDALVEAFNGKVRAAVLMGRDRDRIGVALEGVCPCIDASGMAEAVAIAAAMARPGDTVLLSPACSSLDMFESYVHRGRAFAAAVRALA